VAAAVTEPLSVIVGRTAQDVARRYRMVPHAKGAALVDMLEGKKVVIGTTAECTAWLHDKIGRAALAEVLPVSYAAADKS
jgi:hypothetical protein